MIFEIDAGSETLWEFGETNYIMATVTLYVAIYNLFSSLLHLLGALGNQE